MRDMDTLRSELASEVLRYVRELRVERDASSMKDQSASQCSPSPRSANFPGARAANLALPAKCREISTPQSRRTNGDGHTLDGSGRAGEAEESAPGFEHEGDHFLTEVERAVKVDVDARPDVLARELEEWLHDERGVGIKQRGAKLVRWPLLLDGGEGVLDRLGVGDIACERVGLQQEVAVVNGRSSIRDEVGPNEMRDEVEGGQRSASLQTGQDCQTLTSPPLLRTSSATPSTVLRVRPRTATAE